MRTIALLRETAYRFDFDSCRKVERMHLEGAALGASVRLCKAQDGLAGPTVRTGVVGPDGWVSWDAPLITQPGDRFLAIVDPVPAVEQP